MTRSLRWLALCFVAGRLLAQAPTGRIPDRDRPGPYAFIGAGGSTVTESCTGCLPASGGGVGLTAGFGWALTRRVSVEGSAEGIRRTFNNTLEKSVHLLGGVRIQVTPRVSVRAGGGLAQVRRAQATGATTYHFEHNGPGWAVGVEYAIPISPQTVVVPFLAYRGMPSGDLQREGSPIVSGHSFTVIEVGAKFRWHLRNLVLPENVHRGPEEPNR